MAAQKNTNRRSFISKTVKGGLAIGIGFSAAAPLLQSFTTPAAITTTGFTTGYYQLPLPYAYNALENVIDALTMEMHYSKHAAAYVKNLNEAAATEAVDQSKPLENVLANILKYSAKMRNNAGGHYNHEMFWQCMRAAKEVNAPSGKLLQAIEKQFNSFENFKKQFGDAGKTRFGSGWAWLYINKDKQLAIGSTPNQDNPLMDLTAQAGIAAIKGYPLLALDVWEHAYYLKYQNKRADYVDNWWSIVNWDYVQQRMNTANI